MQESKLLVICPTCQENGRKQVLGEIKDGFLWVMRFHNGYTKIKGEFEVLCNICGELVYFRTINKFDSKGLERRSNEIPNFGSERIFGYTSIQGTI